MAQQPECNICGEYVVYDTVLCGNCGRDECKELLRISQDLRNLKINKRRADYISRRIESIAGLLPFWK